MTATLPRTIAARTTQPMLSIVMPTYNQGQFIRQAIDSVLAQDYRPIELLVFDAVSTDDTVEILRYYAQKHPDVVSYVSRKDRGQSDAINQGLQQAKGDIVCWLNSDDALADGAIRAVIDAFTRHPDVQFVWGRGWTIDEQGRRLGDGGVRAGDAWTLIHQRNFIQQPSCFFRKSVLGRVGPIDEGLHYVMDWELWIRLSAFKGMFIDDYLSANREWGANKTQSGQMRRWREIRSMVRRYCDSAWPPVVWLYLLEAMCQVVRTYRLTRPLESIFGRMFFYGMNAPMSGRYPDGGVRQRFHLSIGNPDSRPFLRLRVTPLSHYDPALLDPYPVVVHWQNSRGQLGRFQFHENGQPQTIDIPLPATGEKAFVHFQFDVNRVPQVIAASELLPQRHIVAFLDGAEPACGADKAAALVQPRRDNSIADS
jgi:glycosyltransferase involved in cell wall biosynthesis